MDDLESAIEVLKQGGVIVYPTETAYGLGCDGRNADAVARIFAIKQRPLEKTVPAIVASLEMAREYAELGPTAEELAQNYWPGPLTLIVQTKKELPSGVCAHDGSIALRVSSHPTCQKLAEGIGGPLVATSANISDHGNKYSLQEVKNELGDLVDWYVDGGVLPHVETSTIVDVRSSVPTIVRQGAIKL